MTSKNSVSAKSIGVNVRSGAANSSLRSRVQSANSNPLIRVEQLKRKFISTQVASLRNEIYATLRHAGSSHAMALAEVDRALREVVLAAQKASDVAMSAAASADAARFDNDNADVVSLRGKFFLSFEPDGTPRWQGRVLAELSPGRFRVQLFEWLTGSPSKKMIVSRSEMSGWMFYPDADSWHADIEHRTGARPLEETSADPDPSTHIVIFSPTKGATHRDN